MATTVYLADPRYNYSGVLANDSMPLNVGYMKAVMDKRLPEVQSRVFAYPDRLLDAIKENPPDVLMVSNYCWNEALSLALIRQAKAIRPDTLGVMGGPNIHLEPERQIEFFAQRPELDVYVLGEGDFIATEVIEHYLAADKSLAKFGDREVSSCIYRRSDGSIVRTETRPRHMGVDDIPSPYLAGIMDEFFDGKMAPMLETNRGCPFTCTFCCQGTSWYTKVHYFSKERVKEEFEYLGKIITERCPHMGTLRLADSNYGMFERDVELSGYIGEVQKKYKYPTYIDATTGKNRAERIIKSLEQVNGALVLYQAVQSLDENVLRNVKRQTIKLEAYEQLQVAIRGRGLRSNSDLILGLPGETLETYMRAVYKLLDSGISQVTNFQLILLKGSELERLDTRKQFKFDTKFRIGPKNFGLYGDEIVFDVEEVVVTTDSLSFDDYLKVRTMALVCAAFWHDNYFEDVIQFAERLGIKRSDWLRALLVEMEHAEGKLKKYVEDFLGETRGELFATKEECKAFYSKPENFERLSRGEIGDNLMHKYRAIASFHIWEEISTMAMQVTKKLIEDHGHAEKIPMFDEFWANLEAFVYLRHAHGHSTDAILSSARGQFTFDIAAWLEAGAPTDPTKFYLGEPLDVEFTLNDEAHRELEAALKVWTDHIRGLTKMVTRIRVASQVRDSQLIGERERAASA